MSIKVVGTYKTGTYENGNGKEKPLECRNTQDSSVDRTILAIMPNFLKKWLSSLLLGCQVKAGGAPNDHCEVGSTQCEICILLYSCIRLTSIAATDAVHPRYL